MAFKLSSFVVFAALCVFSCASSSDLDSPYSLPSLLQHPLVKRNALGAILQLRGASESELRERLAASRGNLAEAVQAVNSALKAPVLSLGPNGVSVDAEAAKKIVSDAIAALKIKVPKVSLDALDRKVRSPSVGLDLAVRSSALSPEDAQRALASSSRRKRSLESKDLIGDIFNSVVGTLVTPIVNGIVDTLTNVLAGFLIVSPPGDFIGDLLAGVVNFVVKTLIDLLAQVQSALGGTPSGNSLRALTTQDDGLLDVIVGPVLAVVSNLTGPVNQVLVNLINLLLEAVQPVLGTIITTELQDVLVAVINLVLPAAQS